MQGRLLPKYQGRYQAHPFGYWEEEFPIAASVGLNLIEFILDYNGAELNPLLSKAGIEEIKKTIESTGVGVKTICADYFMEAPLHSTNDEVAKNSQSILKHLLKSSSELPISDIVIPCVDQSSLSDKKMANRFVQNLIPFLNDAEKYNVNFSLETDLPPQAFAELLNQFDSARVTVNYDIGNSASLGYDLIDEFNCYGDKITDIHIKDRILNGGPVTLGEGNADFSVFFKSLSSLNYKGPFIMQAYRDEQGVDIFKQQLDWIKPYM
jgi:L-ribulose-5-phosphate 3-epimerase